MNEWIITHHLANTVKDYVIVIHITSMGLPISFCIGPGDIKKQIVSDVTLKEMEPSASCRLFIMSGLEKIKWFREYRA